MLPVQNVDILFYQGNDLFMFRPQLLIHTVCCAFNVIVVKSLCSDFQIYHLCALPRAFWCLAVVSFSLFLKVFGMQNKIRFPCTHSSDLIPGFHKLFYRLSVLSSSLFLTSPVLSSSLGLLFSDLWIVIWDLVTSPYWALPFLCLCSFSRGGESEIKKKISMGLAPSSWYQISSDQKGNFLYSWFHTTDWELGHEGLEKGKQRNKKQKQKTKDFQYLWMVGVPFPAP